MSRRDYDEIRNRFADYIRTWKTHDLKVIDEIFDPLVYFKTNTSKKMANGNQDSIFGVYDFINDFPPTDAINSSIYNYVCRIRKDQAFGYCEVVSTAYNKKPFSYLEFTMFITVEWKKEDEKWRIISMRHEPVAHHGDLLEHFRKYWHFEEEDKVGGRIPMIRGEGDSPWNNVSDEEDESELNEYERIKDVIIRNAYGIEHLAFDHTLYTFSNDYQSKVYWSTNKERAKDRVQQLKASRLLLRYYYSAFKFRKIEIKGDRAYVSLDRMRGHQQDLGFQTSSDGNVDLRKRVRDSLSDAVTYPYELDNIDKEYTVARGTYEMTKENGEWKVAYDKIYYGIYESGSYHEDLYGDEC